MIDFYAEKQKLSAVAASINASAEALNLPEMEKELAALRELQHAEGYWNNIEKSTKDNKRISYLEKRMAAVNALLARVNSIEELMTLAEEMQDEETGEEIVTLLAKLENDGEELFLETLLTGKYDANNAILTLHAGAGGTEAQDWVEMLYRMYTRFAERNGYKSTVLDYQDGDEAGIKSVTFQLDGDNAYGFLRAEKGVHRLVRISPFDSNKRRHTSFASLEVMPEIIDNSEIIINSEELRIDNYRSSGAGGQHINKTESAVRITHLPTGIVVQCQNERSQIQNKETAMKMLLSKLIERKEREQQEQADSIKGELKKIEWGSQIRSYVFCPYTLVKDHRTGYENPNVAAVMDGDIMDFIRAYLIKAR